MIGDDEDDDQGGGGGGDEEEAGDDESWWLLALLPCPSWRGDLVCHSKNRQVLQHVRVACGRRPTRG